MTRARQLMQVASGRRWSSRAASLYRCPMTSPPRGHSPGDVISPGTAPGPDRSLYATDAQQFALLVDSVREYAIYMLDPTGVVRTWNVGGQRIKGYLPREIIGRHFSQMFTPEDRDARKPWLLLERAEREGS